jgi:methionine-rich copper-binding protein CopC
MKACKRFFVSISILLFIARTVAAHAFLDHADPEVGSRIRNAPTAVRAWFTERLEPAFCRLQVFDGSGTEIDRRDMTADAANGAELKVSLPVLKPGKYKVVWHAVSIDTHSTNGEFTFEVAPELK